VILLDYIYEFIYTVLHQQQPFSACVCVVGIKRLHPPCPFFLKEKKGTLFSVASVIVTYDSTAEMQKVGPSQLGLLALRPRSCLFQLPAASAHQKLLRTAKRSAFHLASIKFVGAKIIQNQHKYIIG
jgi:hypothetical protein